MDEKMETIKIKVFIDQIIKQRHYLFKDMSDHKIHITNKIKIIKSIIS